MMRNTNQMHVLPRVSASTQIEKAFKNMLYSRVLKHYTGVRPMTLSKPRISLFSGILAILLIGLYFYSSRSEAKPKPMAAPKVVVSTAKATLQLWQPHINALGTSTAIQSIDLSPQVSGIVKTIAFKSGQHVTEGQLMVKLEDTVLQASRESNTAQLKLTKANFERSLKLYRKKLVSSLDFDTRRSAYQESLSDLHKINAQIAQTVVNAPFSGQLGIRNVNIGEYVSPGAKMVSLQMLAPMYIDFNIPEKFYTSIKVNNTLKITTKAYAKRVFIGKVIAISPHVDLNTRSFKVRSITQNNGKLLTPGMFVEVRVAVGKPQKMIVVPQTAITYRPYGESIYVIKKGGKAHLQYVKVGDLFQDKATITSGLKNGDEVVIAGQVKLHDGASVIVKNPKK